MKFDPSIGENLYCPVCWNQFGPDSIDSQLSLEHVPPTSTAKLIGERVLETLTCRECNNTHGTKHQNDLKHFLIHQLRQSGNYDGKIPGQVTIPGSSALKCNIVWNKKGIQIIGVPKANNPLTVKEHESILNRFVETESSNWSFQLEENPGYRRDEVWNSYFHAAYLMANIRTRYMYSFTRAGLVLRKLIMEGNCSQLGVCIIPTEITGIHGSPWIAEVEEPSDLRCLWIKVAGNIVILPQSSNTELAALYKAWQEASKLTDFGLLPIGDMPFRLRFYTSEDLIEAQKCLPTVFGKSSY